MDPSENLLQKKDEERQKVILLHLSKVADLEKQAQVLGVGGGHPAAVDVLLAAYMEIGCSMMATTIQQSMGMHASLMTKMLDSGRLLVSRGTMDESTGIGEGHLIASPLPARCSTDYSNSLSAGADDVTQSLLHHGVGKASAKPEIGAKMASHMAAFREDTVKRCHRKGGFKTATDVEGYVKAMRVFLETLLSELEPYVQSLSQRSDNPSLPLPPLLRTAESRENMPLLLWYMTRFESDLAQLQYGNLSCPPRQRCTVLGKYCHLIQVLLGSIQSSEERYQRTRGQWLHRMWLEAPPNGRDAAVTELATSTRLDAFNPWLVQSAADGLVPAYAMDLYFALFLYSVDCRSCQDCFTPHSLDQCRSVVVVARNRIKELRNLQIAIKCRETSTPWQEMAQRNANKSLPKVERPEVYCSNIDEAAEIVQRFLRFADNRQRGGFVMDIVKMNKGLKGEYFLDRTLMATRIQAAARGFFVRRKSKLFEHLVQKYETDMNHYRQPAKPTDPAICGHNPAPWALINWALRVRYDLLDTSIEDAVRAGADQVIQALGPFIRILEEALYFFRVNTWGVAYRGLGVPLGSRYNVKDALVLPPFSSSSTMGTVALGFMRSNAPGTFFIMKNHSGVPILHASWYPEQCERLISNFSMFRVVAKMPRSLLQMLHRRYDIITLVEEGGPESTDASVVDDVVKSVAQTVFVYDGFLSEYVEGRLSGERDGGLSGQPLFLEMEEWLTLQTAPTHLLLLGSGGSGKTSATLALLSWLATRSIREDYFPIFLPLPTIPNLFEPGAIFRHLLQTLCLTSKQFDLLCATRQVVLLLDSLDEVAGVDRLHESMATEGGLLDRNPELKAAHHYVDLVSGQDKFRRVRVIVSSRDEILAPFKDARAIMLRAETAEVGIRWVQPFTQAEVAQYVNKALVSSEARAKAVIQRMKELKVVGASEGFMRLPLTVSMLTTVLEDAFFFADNAVTTRAVIYEEFLIKGMKAVEGPLFLTSVALLMLERGTWVLTVGEAHQLVAEAIHLWCKNNDPSFPSKKGPAASDILSVAPCRFDSLDDPAATFSWRHKTIGEYLSALGIWIDPCRALASVGRRFFLDTPGVIQFFGEIARREHKCHPVHYHATVAQLEYLKYSSARDVVKECASALVSASCDGALGSTIDGATTGTKDTAPPKVVHNQAESVALHKPQQPLEGSKPKLNDTDSALFAATTARFGDQYSGVVKKVRDMVQKFGGGGEVVESCLPSLLPCLDMCLSQADVEHLTVEITSLASKKPLTGAQNGALVNDDDGCTEVICKVLSPILATGTYLGRSIALPDLETITAAFMYLDASRSGVMSKDAFRSQLQRFGEPLTKKELEFAENMLFDCATDEFRFKDEYLMSMYSVATKV